MRYFFYTTLIVVALFLQANGLSARPTTTISSPGRVTDYRQFSFLYEYTKTPLESETIFRPIIPLYSTYYNEERDFHYRSVIFPLFYWNGTYSWNRWGFLDLFVGDSRYHQDESEDTDLIIPPFVIGRGKTPEERYFGVFPFYGTVKNKFSWSRIDFILWPLYTGWEYKDYRAHSILWPIFMVGKSPVRDDFRLLFVYSSKVHRGKYNRKSLLWPFFQWGREDLDKKDPRSFFFFFPFYGRKWSDSGSLQVHTFLWPLFSWGRDEKRGSLNIHLFWILYQYEKNDAPYLRRHVIFPFYGYYRFGSEDGKYWKEMRYYTPFYLRLENDSGSIRSRKDFFGLFLYQRMKTQYLKEDEREDYYKLWPIFHFRNDTRGERELSVLSLWPMRSDQMDRVWAPIISGSLFEYRQYRNRDKYISFALRLFSRRWNEEDEHLFLAGWEFHKNPKRWSVELLGGLFGFGHKKGENGEDYERFFRAFWFEI